MFGGDIRAIVPQIAMSAGTMMAVACKSIVMGKQSGLGPTDPQVNGFSAYAIKKQFERARAEITSNHRVASAWQPILRQINVDFLEQCNLVMEYAEDFVTRALQENMLKDDKNAKAKAAGIAKKFGDLGENKSHSRRFHYAKCKDMGLTIELLEDDQELQDLVLTIHHCYMHGMGNIVKVIENHKGRIWGQQISSTPRTPEP